MSKDKIIVRKIQKPKDYSASEMYEKDNEIGIVLEKRSKHEKSY